jgi:MoxR-like ATPase
VMVPPIGARTMSTMLTQRVRGAAPAAKPVLDAPALKTLFALVDRVHLPQPVADFIGRLVEASDPRRPEATASVKRFVRYGASPRAALGMAAGARASALSRGKPNIGFDEVIDVASAVLNHRLVLSYEAQLEKVSAQQIIDELIKSVPEVARA